MTSFAQVILNQGVSVSFTNNTGRYVYCHTYIPTTQESIPSLSFPPPLHPPSLLPSLCAGRVWLLLPSLPRYPVGLPEHLTIDALVSCSWLVDAPDGYTSDTRRCKNIPSICCIACSYLFFFFLCKFNSLCS